MKVLWSFIQLKHMTNSKPCYWCLPNTWKPSSLSSLTLSCCCMDPSPDLIPAQTHSTSCCPPGLLHWWSSKYPLLHAPAICTVVLLCCTGYPAHHTSPSPIWGLTELFGHLFLLSIALYPMCPIHKDIFYSWQKLTSHWSCVVTIHAGRCILLPFSSIFPATSIFCCSLSRLLVLLQPTHPSPWLRVRSWESLFFQHVL